MVTVHTELDKEVQKYFVSGGFAFVHPDSSADICAVEAVKVRCCLLRCVLRCVCAACACQRVCAYCLSPRAHTYRRCTARQVTDLDVDAVRAGLAEYTNKLAGLQGKGDDYELAAAQVRACLVVCVWGGAALSCGRAVQCSEV